MRKIRKIVTQAPDIAVICNGRPLPMFVSGIILRCICLAKTFRRKLYVYSYNTPHRRQNGEHY